MRRVITERENGNQYHAITKFHQHEAFLRLFWSSRQAFAISMINPNFTPSQSPYYMEFFKKDNEEEDSK
jgi:hypothetical protein